MNRLHANMNLIILMRFTNELKEFIDTSLLPAATSFTCTDRQEMVRILSWQMKFLVVCCHVEAKEPSTNPTSSSPSQLKSKMTVSLCFTATDCLQCTSKLPSPFNGQ